MSGGLSLGREGSRVLCVSMGALVREGHPHYIGEEGEEVAPLSCKEGERWRNRFCMHGEVAKLSELLKW